ncbi:MAG TPA: UbiA family prenyltransferase [Longimicrobiaceae bacterium]|nr:UbiA family prenyltransferase [Longimicrobiaceae bacterium]
MIRSLGYRLLPGDAFSYILHMRPREWPIMAAHTAFGLILAVGSGSGELAIGHALAGIAVYVLLLNGATLSINSAFDRDEGDVGYLDAPPHPPAHLFSFSLTLLVVGQILAVLFFPWLFALVYGLCFAMSVLYSVPPFRWKAIGGLDIIINAIGFGFLTPLAGWSLTGAPVPLWAWLVMLGFCPLFAALYPLTQLYQFEEDSVRGDRTFALVLGMRRSLQFALVAAFTAFAFFGAGALMHGTGWWYLLLVPFAAWAAVLVTWYLRQDSLSADQHKRGMYAALNAWAVTDIAVAAIFILPL